MDARQLRRKLIRLGACNEPRAWCHGKSLAEAWEQCQRGDWLLWLCARMEGEKGWPSRQDIVLAACACVEPALKFVRAGEERSSLAIETVRRWAVGATTLQETYEAGSVARDAAVDANSKVHIGDAEVDDDPNADATVSPATAISYSAAYATAAVAAIITYATARIVTAAAAVNAATAAAASASAAYAAAYAVGNRSISAADIACRASLALSADIVRKHIRLGWGTRGTGQGT
jgi:hypothetical protein